jgi:hypothetical protein
MKDYSPVSMELVNASGERPGYCQIKHGARAFKNFNFFFLYFLIVLYVSIKNKF